MTATVHGTFVDGRPSCAERPPTWWLPAGDERGLLVIDVPAQASKDKQFLVSGSDGTQAAVDASAVQRRIDVLDTMRQRHPDVAWQLMMALLPAPMALYDRPNISQ